MSQVTKKKLTIVNSRGIGLHSEMFLTNSTPESTPFVILCHGFTGDRSEWGRYPETMEKLAEKGYDCLSFDFSGSGENVREVITLDKQIKDLEDVFAWCSEQGYKRIATIGLSFGGITSLAANLPDRKVAIYWAPAFYMKEVIGKRNINLIKFVGKFRKKPISRASSNPDMSPILFDSTFVESILNNPPGKYLETVKIPSLIVHGKDDKGVNIEGSRRAINLMPNDIPHQLIEIPGTGHDFSGTYLTQFIDHSLAWLEKYL